MFVVVYFFGCARVQRLQRRGAEVVVVAVALAGWRWRLRFGRWLVA